MAGIRQRGLDGNAGPVDDAPTPDEPGHPEYHRRQRAAFALTRWTAAVPPRYAHATATHPDVQAWADTCARAPKDAGTLVLSGSIGTGKTFQAFGALRRIAETGPAQFEMIATTAPDMYAKLRPGGSERGSEDELKRHTRIQLLLLDDLGTEKPSEWVEEVNYRILNERYNACRPLIITTNLLVRGPEGGRTPDLASRLGERLASRLAETAHVVTLTGADLRRHRAAS
jgi:DNA replication protein DnaC